MNKSKSFLGYNRALITPILSSNTEVELINEIQECLEEGAEAFTLLIERLPLELRREEKLKKFFTAMQDKPIYVACYENGDVVRETDVERAEHLVRAIEWGATMVDIRGDMFASCETEITFDEYAVKKQKQLVQRIHGMGGEIIMSTHFRKNGAFSFLPKEKVVSVAKAQEERGTDIVKIITNANNEIELEQNFQTLLTLKKEIKKPTVFLCNGTHCIRHRFAAPLIGSPIAFTKAERYITPNLPYPSNRKMKELFDCLNYQL